MRLPVAPLCVVDTRSQDTVKHDARLGKILLAKPSDGIPRQHSEVPQPHTAGMKRRKADAPVLTRTRPRVADAVVYLPKGRERYVAGPGVRHRWVVIFGVGDGVYLFPRPPGPPLVLQLVAPDEEGRTRRTQLLH